MDIQRQTVVELFALIDGVQLPPKAFTRAVLERILYVDPCCARARELLGALDGPPPREDQVLSAIELAEELSAHGVWYGARTVAEEIRKYFPQHPIAREWLGGAHLLWDASPACSQGRSPG